MVDIRPFRALRPAAGLEREIAALPYDVMDKEEARAEIKERPLSFLRVTRPEAELPDSVVQYDPAVYQKARTVLRQYINDGLLVQDPEPYFYIYRQKMGKHEQVGLVAVSPVEEYRLGKIKKHELTRLDKEDDRVRHIQRTAAQTGPVFLSYKRSPHINRLITGIMAKTLPVCDFIASDGIGHALYVVRAAPDIATLSAAFARIDSLYIADGHHRSAAALRVAELARANNTAHSGEESYNYFLTVIFPDDMLQILDYNRAVTDLNRLSGQDFLARLSENFIVEKLPALSKPAQQHDFSLYLAGAWYCLRAKPGSFQEDSPTGRLDVSILQNNLLRPLLGVNEPRTDKRIQFIGGIRGLEELARLVDSGKAAAVFVLYPTSMKELMAIADAGEIMPPKSTWFEPKLRDAMVIHLIEDKFLGN